MGTKTSRVTQHSAVAPWRTSGTRARCCFPPAVRASLPFGSTAKLSLCLVQILCKF
jgi:hypothetical protein